MNVTDLRTFIGKFGVMVARDDGYEKTIPGYLKDMDTRGTVWFVDNEGYGYAFKAERITSFEEKEFEPLPELHKGKEVYWKGGVLYYTGTKQEVDLKK